MGTMNKFKMCNKKSSLVGEGQVIVAYKKGSGGQVLCVYESSVDICRRELVYNSRFKSSCITSNLIGASKSIKLLHLQAVCVLRVKNISELKEAAL